MPVINLPGLSLLSSPGIYKWYRFMQKTQYWNKELIEQYQLNKLQELVNHAYKNVPYYSQLFNKLKLVPDDITSYEKLSLLPVLTRDDVKKNYGSLLAVNYKKFSPQKRKTGGTTGTPLHYYSDKKSWNLHWASKYRAWQWSGYKFGQPIGVMGGASIIPGKKSFKRKIWNRVNNFFIFSASHMSSEIMSEYAGIIKRNNIKFLRGYPSSIAHFARYCIYNNISLPLECVITTAEVLQLQYRQSIAEAFNCAVVDTYGCADGGGSANTCLHNKGFHISFEASIWEVCDSKGRPVPEGEKGELTLTSLTNFAMPLLRYQPGDIIENTIDYTPCTCGRTLPRVKEISGRKTDILSFSNGVTLGGPAFTLLFREFSLKNYQLIQTGKSCLNIRIVPDSGFNNEQELKIKQLMRMHCGEGVNITIEQLKEIETPVSGKHRFIINNSI